jgi:hypothetical protein
VGDVVKVGDKFGIRIKEVLPSLERYIPVWPNPENQSPSVSQP